MRKTSAETSWKLEKVGRPCRKIRRGAAAVEFAVVAPVFFLMIFGMLEFGRMVMVQQVLTNASREGARVAVLDGATNSEVVDAVEAYLTGGQIDASAATVTVDPEDPASAGYGEAVTVTVSVAFGDVSWLSAPFFAEADSDLTASTSMRRETVQ